MSVRYFKKLEPATKVVLSNGSSVQFSTLDGLIGYFATKEEFVQQELDRFIKENRYGITEVTEAEHISEYRKKKETSRPLQPVYREEIGSGSKVVGNDLLARLGHKVGTAVAVEPASHVSAMAAPAPAPAKEEFKPSLGRRGAKKPKP